MNSTNTQNLPRSDDGEKSRNETSLLQSWYNEEGTTWVPKEAMKNYLDYSGNTSYDKQNDMDWYSLPAAETGLASNSSFLAVDSAATDSKSRKQELSRDSESLKQATEILEALRGAGNFGKQIAAELAQDSASSLANRGENQVICQKCFKFKGRPYELEYDPLNYRIISMDPNIYKKTHEKT